jgi:uncharacterized protein YndB with AHSA1/START domain
MNQNHDAYGEFTNPGEVRLVRLLPAPIDRVWAFLTDSDKRALWFAPGPMDLKPGGKVRFEFDHETLSGGEVRVRKSEGCTYGPVVEGEVRQCKPPNLLTFTMDKTEATFELEAHGDATRLVLTHRRLDTPAQMISVAAGWHTHVAYLIAKLGGGEAPPFWATHARLEQEYADRLPVPA